MKAMTASLQLFVFNEHRIERSDSLSKLFALGPKGGKRAKIDALPHVTPTSFNFVFLYALSTFA
jgi:hypothetical protein